MSEWTRNLLKRRPNLEHSFAADSKYLSVFQSTQLQVCATAGRLLKTTVAATAEKSIPIDVMLKKVDKILRNDLIDAKTQP